MDDLNIKPRQVKCPQCGRFTLYTPENSYRPFCSERCRLIDLGEWAKESYRIPVSPSSSDVLNEEDDYNEPTPNDRN